MEQNTKLVILEIIAYFCIVIAIVFIGASVATIKITPSSFLLFVSNLFFGFCIGWIFLMFLLFGMGIFRNFWKQWVITASVLCFVFALGFFYAL
jgi:hypothetical protein